MLVSALRSLRVYSCSGRWKTEPEALMYVPKMQDNGFWMTIGTRDEMLATFSNPWASCFPGALGVSRYIEYKTYVIQNLAVFNATRYTENLYSVGYKAL